MLKTLERKNSNLILWKKTTSKNKIRPIKINPGNLALSRFQCKNTIDGCENNCPQERETFWLRFWLKKSSLFLKTYEFEYKRLSDLLKLWPSPTFRVPMRGIHCSISDGKMQKKRDCYGVRFDARNQSREWLFKTKRRMAGKVSKIIAIQNSIART